MSKHKYRFALPVCALLLAVLLCACSQGGLTMVINGDSGKTLVEALSGYYGEVSKIELLDTLQARLNEEAAAADDEELQQKVRAVCAEVIAYAEENDRKLTVRGYYLKSYDLLYIIYDFDDTAEDAKVNIAADYSTGEVIARWLGD